MSLPHGVYDKLRFYGVHDALSLYALRRYCDDYSKTYESMVTDQDFGVWFSALQKSFISLRFLCLMGRLLCFCSDIYTTAFCKGLSRRDGRHTRRTEHEFLNLLILALDVHGP